MPNYTREELIYLAKISEQTQRYEDMLEYMKTQFLLEEEQPGESSLPLNKKEESKGSKYISLLKNQKKKIEDELSNFCKDIFEFLDYHLINKSNSNEAKVFFLKMKGDYYRQIFDYYTINNHDEAAKSALQAYCHASDIAIKELNTTHPTRLGLALNFSVFYYEVMNNPTTAQNLAKQAFQDALADIENIKENQFKDATTIMQLIRDNLAIWTSELQNNDEGSDTQDKNI
ncbi:hypothetical protein ABPG72_012931 [Tetrahymena utriculariae]